MLLMNIKSLIAATSNTFAFLPIRLGVGVIMIAHGCQKLFGWFGGYGLQGTGQFFAEKLGLEPGVLMAGLAGGTELVGGALLIIGLMTRLAGLAIAGTMAVAITTAHSSAFFLPEGMEFALILLLASVTLVIGGAGKLSFDRKLSTASKSSS
jgi:putative oxidoreductase